MKTIPLTKGFTAIVDDEDFAKVNNYKWHAKTDIRKDGTVLVYAKRREWNKQTKTSQLIFLHRYVLGIRAPISVDHRDGDGLNCTKSNLRIATATQQLGNTRKRSGCVSQYKGVCWFKPAKLWRTRISFQNKDISKYFEKEILAALEYDWLARKIFKEFAKTNFSLCPMTISYRSVVSLNTSRTNSFAETSPSSL